MPNTILILRSNTAGNVPAGATPAGSPWVNWADMEFGVADGTAPRQLLAVRFWTANTAYAVGDHVLSAGQIYRATAANTGSTPPSANWALAGGAVTSVAGRTGAVVLDHNDITDWTTTLAPYALLAGAAFTGAVTGLTRPPADSTVNFATTAFVSAAVAAATAGVSDITAGAGITLGGTGPTGSVTIAVANAGVTNAMLANMGANTFKGATAAGPPIDIPAATVLTTIGAYPNTNPNGYQTAAQVAAAIPGAENANPIMDGTAAPGSAALWSRGDHVHPSDTSKASLTGATFTGPVNGVAPTVATNLTTKNYVDTLVAGLSQYKGAYDASANTPALNPPVGANSGDYWIVNVAGTAVAGMPGITAGTALGVSDLIFWDGTNLAHLVGGSLTAAIGDARYVNITGDTMMGALTLSADPAGPLQPVTLQYLQNYPIDAGTF